MQVRKYIPNTLTLCNLLAGCAGVVFAVRGNFSAVLVCLMLSELFDFSDGFSARKLKAYSDIGKELDSLADLVSFGLCPSVCLFSWYGIAQPDIQLLRWFPFLIAAASALRLAKFNIDTRQSTSFLGLATSGCALLLIPLACSLFGIPNDVAMQVVAIGFIIGVIQDSCETALNSSSDALFTATAEYRDWIKAGRKFTMGKDNVPMEHPTGLAAKAAAEAEAAAETAE